MRKALLVFLALGFLAFLAESGSSYVIYRYYAMLHRAYYPAGSATAALLRFIIKGGGRHDEVTLSIDHAPLFHADPRLGYALYPGKYRITEQRGGQSHRFTLTVDEHERRITSWHPNGSVRRIFITGDSAMFGWGLNDEQTVPWLLQSRLPGWDVVNLSLTSYSTVSALLQLEAARPPVGADDIVVLTYHPITNGFNVASPEMLGYLTNGFEQQLGDAELVRSMRVPVGRLVEGELKLGYYAVACGNKAAVPPGCTPPHLNDADAMKISEKAFDAIMAAHPAHYVVAFLSGAGSDPVIAHLRTKGVAIADVRTAPGDPDASDEVSIDEHAGPFWHHMLAERLSDVLLQLHLVD